MTPEERIERLEYVLRTLIVWMTGSANSPISHTEMERLLERLSDDPR